MTIFLSIAIFLFCLLSFEPVTAVTGTENNDLQETFSRVCHGRMNEKTFSVENPSIECLEFIFDLFTSHTIQLIYSQREGVEPTRAFISKSGKLLNVSELIFNGYLYMNTDLFVDMLFQFPNLEKIQLHRTYFNKKMTEVERLKLEILQLQKIHHSDMSKLLTNVGIITVAELIDDHSNRDLLSETTFTYQRASCQEETPQKTGNWLKRTFMF